MTQTQDGAGDRAGDRAGDGTTAPPQRKRVQFGKYTAVGLAAFAVDYGLLIVLHSVLGWPAWLGAVLAFAVSTVISFLGQRSFTFNSPVRRRQAAWRYGVLLAVNMTVTAVVVDAFDRFLGLYLIGKLITSAVTALWSFWLMRHWVYPRAPRD